LTLEDFNLRPLSPSEFRDRIRRFQEIYPDYHISSTWRSEVANMRAQGNPSSDHLESPLEPIACDLVWTGLDSREPPSEECVHTAHTLGLYAIYHDKGTGFHLHTQANPPGDIPVEYRTKYRVYRSHL